MKINNINFTAEEMAKMLLAEREKRWKDYDNYAEHFGARKAETRSARARACEIDEICEMFGLISYGE